MMANDLRCSRYPGFTKRFPASDEPQFEQCNRRISNEEGKSSSTKVPTSHWKEVAFATRVQTVELLIVLWKM
jgi:hypothetical protein